MSRGNSTDIDWALLTQYQEILGTQGISDSFQMFLKVLPDYQAEFEQLVLAQNEPGVRSQAHKIKGSCRSLGFKRLGEIMQFIEKEAWQWQEVEAHIAQWPHHYAVDTAIVEEWLTANR